MITYKDAGVDIKKGDLFVDRIKPFSKKTLNKNVKSGIGGFCALYDQGHKYLAAATDGVGTKLKLALDLGIHHTIGQDLVAMCVNDLLCVGAKPLFFLDYLATGKLDLSIHTEVVRGIANACEANNIALLGGETAEMPGMYDQQEYDLAGFCVGEVLKHRLIDGSSVKSGDLIVGLPSSGPHSNGFSLIRKLINKNEIELLKQCLTPTKIYTHEILPLIQKQPQMVKGMAHITGGGFDNINRINPHFEYKVEKLPRTSLFEEIQRRSKLNDFEMQRTFNMGIGYVLIIDKNFSNYLPEDSLVIGRVD